MEAVLEKHRWESIAEGIPEDAVRIVRKAEEIIDRLNVVIGMISGKEELTTVEENLEVMLLGVSIESLVNMLISQVKLHGGSGPEIDQLIAEYRNLVREVQESQASGSFASTPKGTAEYIVKILNILERVFVIMATTKYLWMIKLGSENLPRRNIRDAVHYTIKKYLDTLLPIARQIVTQLESTLPKYDPESLLEKAAFYVLVAPTKYIPKRTYLLVLNSYLNKREYKPIKKLIEMYEKKTYQPYVFEAVKNTKYGYLLSMMYEQELVTTLLYRQSVLESQLSNIDIDTIFEPLSIYTKEEIEITMMSTRDVKNVELFWEIFVKVALKSVGVHVEWEFEEEEKKSSSNKKKKSKKKEITPESLEVGESFEIELPPEVGMEISELAEEII